MPRATNSLFEVTILHCIYERVSNRLRFSSIQKFSRSHEEASDEDLQILRASPGARDIPKESEEKETGDPFKDIPILHHASAELYLFDTDTDVFVLQEKSVSVDLASNGVYDGPSNALPVINR